MASVDDTITFVKAEAFLLLLVVGFVGGLLPLKARDMPHNRERILGVGNVFSGGLFLAAGFIHMLGEAIEGFYDADEHIAVRFCLYVCQSRLDCSDKTNARHRHDAANRMRCFIACWAFARHC